jgi:hypothetical protein
MTVYHWTKLTNHGTGNTSDTNMWSATQGGTGGAGVPTYLDDVKFDAGSFDQAGAVVTHSSDTRFHTMDWTGALFNPTFARGATGLNIYGSLAFIAGMTITGNSQINLRSTSKGNTIATGGQTLAGGLNPYGIGGDWTQLDDIALSSYFVFDYSNWYTNGKSITCTIFSDDASATTKVINLNNNPLPVTYDTTGRTITGQVNMVHKLPNGNYLYCCGRGVAAHIGVSEVNPTTNEEVFNYQDPTWNPADNGPESCYKYSNGNYLISDCDGGASIYEMQPDHTKVWTYTWNKGMVAAPLIIGGIDCIGITSYTHLRIIKRSDQSIVWDGENLFTNTDHVDYRLINGKGKLVVSDWVAHTLNVVDCDTKVIEWTYATAGSAGPFNVAWLNDTQIFYGNGVPQVFHIINFDSLKQIVWTSRTMDGTAGGLGLYDSTHAAVSENTAVIKFIDITQGASTINCTSWELTGSNTSFYPGLSVIKVSGTGHFKGNAQTYNEVQLNGTAHDILTSNAFQRLKLASGTTQTITFTDTTTQTIVKPQSGDLSGSAGHVHTLQGSGAGGWALVKTASGRISFDYLSISRSTVTSNKGANYWYAGPLAHSTNGGSNSGWIFSANPMPKLLAAGVI